MPPLVGINDDDSDPDYGDMLSLIGINDDDSNSDYRVLLCKEDELDTDI